MSVDERMIDEVAKIINESENVVVLSGRKVFREIGLNGVTAEHMAYDIEAKYGHSSNEIVTAAFLNWRVEDFFDYFKNVILNPKVKEIPDSVKDVKKLMDYGRVKKVVTRDVYSLYSKAGCEEDDVIALNGTVEDNKCPNCGKIYSSDYVLDNGPVPTCADCKVPLRPGFGMYNEMMDSGKINDSCQAVEDADVVIILGSSAKAKVFNNLLRYIEEEKLIIISDVESFGDEVATYRLYGNISDIMNKITEKVTKVEKPEKEEEPEVPEADDKEADAKEVDEKTADATDSKEE
ncbi:MAG: hypothetical protein K6D02_07060 [Lachnospiraceae bacterium]|nr:hypothetical protein [Lachnospiraceae bacterium]